MNLQTEKYFEPVKQLNALALENLEKLLDIQLKAINDTARVGVEQLKSAANINDADSLKEYFANQAETAKTFGERFVKDTQTAIELGKNYSDKVQGVITDAVKPETNQKAKPKTRQAQD